MSAVIISRSYIFLGQAGNPKAISGIVYLEGNPANLAAATTQVADKLAIALAQTRPQAMSALELADLAKSSVEAARDESFALGAIKFGGSLIVGGAVGAVLTPALTPIGGAAAGFAASKVFEDIFDRLRAIPNSDGGIPILSPEEYPTQITDEIDGGPKVNSNTWKEGAVKYVRSGNDLIVIINDDGRSCAVFKGFDFDLAKESNFLGIHLPGDDEDKKPRRPGGGGGPGGGVSGGVTGGTGAVRPGDPLVLDLDGDGVELTTNANTILFDHNQDGVRTGTQWVKADDGMLVRDLNGNGAIDSGRELFGDQTQISATPQNPSGLARNGFEALRALDSNGDNRINASDTAYGELKVWRDLNQDGISQANELQSLGDAGISEIHLGQIETAGTGAAGAPLINTDRRGETTGQSSYARNGSEQTLRNINFRQDTFVREFTDNPTVTAVTRNSIALCAQSTTDNCTKFLQNKARCSSNSKYCKIFNGYRPLVHRGSVQNVVRIPLDWTLRCNFVTNDEYYFYRKSTQ